MTPRFHLTLDLRGSVSVEFHDPVPQLLRLDVAEEMEPWHRRTVRSWDALAEAIREDLEGWLRGRAQEGALYYDFVRRCWRYRL